MLPAVCGTSSFFSAALLVSGGQLLVTMFLIISVATYYTVQFTKEQLSQFLLYTSIIFFSGVIFICTTNVLLMFIAYELLLLPTALIVDLYSKTTRAKEAASFMII